MINSRDLNDLHPAVKRRALAMISACDADGITLLITSTYRDNASQDKLYAQPWRSRRPGRDQRQGRSVLPQLAAGVRCRAVGQRETTWSTSGDAGKLWRKIGLIGKSCGLEWAGDWKRFPEFPHFQYTGGLTLADLQAGKKLRGDA